MQELSEIDPDKLHFSAFTDANLETYIAAGITNSVKYAAAIQVRNERQLARENTLHAELLAEIKRPHWSVTPTFWVGVIAMVAACIAAYGVLFPSPQLQSSATAIVPATQTVKPGHSTLSNLQQQTPNSLPVPKSRVKN
jgi:hypothetical protein